MHIQWLIVKNIFNHKKITPNLYIIMLTFAVFFSPITETYQSILRHHLIHANLNISIADKHLIQNRSCLQVCRLQQPCEKTTFLDLFINASIREYFQSRDVSLRNVDSQLLFSEIHGENPKILDPSRWIHESGFISCKRRQRPAGCSSKAKQALSWQQSAAHSITLRLS